MSEQTAIINALLVLLEAELNRHALGTPERERVYDAITALEHAKR